VNIGAFGSWEAALTVCEAKGAEPVAEPTAEAGADEGDAALDAKLEAAEMLAAGIALVEEASRTNTASERASRDMLLLGGWKGEANP
jgi:hypothetical protein